MIVAYSITVEHARVGGRGDGFILLLGFCVVNFITFQTQSGKILKDEIVILIGIVTFHTAM